MIIFSYFREIHTHDIGLGTDGNQTVDVLADGHKHLTGHVATLLGTGGLVLNVDTGGTALDEQLGELHDGGQTTVTGIGIGNDGTEVVDVGDVGALALGGGDALLALLPVVEQLGHEQLVDLVGDGVHGVIGQIGRGLVGGRGGGRALPARHVDGVEELGHLGDHGGVKAAIGGAGLFFLRLLVP